MAQDGVFVNTCNSVALGCKGAEVYAGLSKASALIEGTGKVHRGVYPPLIYQLAILLYRSAPRRTQPPAFKQE